MKHFKNYVVFGLTVAVYCVAQAQLTQFNPSEGKVSSHIGIGKVPASADSLRAGSLFTPEPNAAAPLKGSIFDGPDFPIGKPGGNEPQFSTGPGGGIVFPLPIRPPSGSPIGPPIGPPNQPELSCKPAPGGNPCNAPSGPATKSATAPAAGAGNPINVITGNKYQNEVDMAALPGALGLEIVRHYNSAYAVSHAPIDALGRGWRISYDTRLYASERSIQIVQADGVRVIFNRNAVNPSLCTSGNGGDGWVRVERSRSQGELIETFVWHWTNGRQLTFSATGKLVQIKEPTGEFVTLSYDPVGRLSTVIDPSSRKLTFQYQAKTRRLASIESPLGIFTYLTTDNNGKPSENLMGVQPPSASLLATRLYYYEDPRWISHLTGISAAIQAPSTAGKLTSSTPQRLTTYLYDEEGRGVLSTKGHPAKLVIDASGIAQRPYRLDPGTGIEQIHLQYIDRATPTQNGTTVLTNAVGETTTYKHRIIAGQYRLIESRGAGCGQCGDINVGYAYNAFGQLTASHRLDTDGKIVSTQTNTYDTRGRLANVTEKSLLGLAQSDGKTGDNNPTRFNSTRFSYHGNSHFISEISKPSVVAGQDQSTRTSYNAYGQVLLVTQTGLSPAAGDQATAFAIERTTRYQYELIAGRSLLVAIDGPLPNGPLNGPADSDVTKFSYDTKGSQITRIVAPLDLESTLQYDIIGRINSVTGPSGRTDTYQYVRGSDLVESVVQSFAQVNSKESTPQVSDLNKHYGIAYSYNALGQVNETFKVVNGVRTASQLNGYDESQRLTWQAQALGLIGKINYDSDSKIIKSQVHNGRQMQEASFGTHLGQPANSALSDITTAASNQSDVNHTIYRPVLDDFGRTVAVTMPDTGTVQFSYDVSDRLIASTDAMGNRITYLYDPANRMIKQTVTDGQTDQVKSDQIGEAQVTEWQYIGTQVSKVTHANQTETYQYTNQGFIASKTIQLARANQPLPAITTRYSYDDSGRLISMSLPDATQMLYQRNGQGQVVALTRARLQTPWLRWLAKDQAIASDIQRDIVGLSQLTTGNGLQSSRLRDQNGVLGRVVHRQNRPRLGDTSTAQTLALFEHAYLWDTRGNLIQSRGQVSGGNPKLRSYAYDNQDQLIASVQRTIGDMAALRKVSALGDVQGKSKVSTPAAHANTDATPADLQLDRYFYDSIGRRLLSQENVNDENDLTNNVLKSSYGPTQRTGTKSYVNHGEQEPHDANGNPIQSKALQYRWNALGQLLQVSKAGSNPNEGIEAKYQYNHRGERVAKSVTRKNSTTTQRYLYEHRQIAAELNGDGTITRQYIYLADQAVAFIDYPKGQVIGSSIAAGSEHIRQSPLAIIRSDLGKIFDHWFGKAESIAYLHANHLGAIEAITDSAGESIWQASYAPFGAVVINSKTSNQQSATKFNFRLPGQYEDEETGLYYNDNRYYDPRLGRYLSPDPLGMPDGPNRYAYVRNNPLRYIDVNGLILFAFDGTNNSSPPPKGDTASNVRKFFETYNDGRSWYMNGVGRPDPESGIGTSTFYNSWRDIRDANTARDRNNFMFERLNQYVLATTIPMNEKISIDIIGFSRGAAMARDFANQVSNAIDAKLWNNKTPCVEIRFLGLWDTVAQFGANGAGNGSWQLAIPTQVKFAAHAVALNEHRYLFPSESMGSDSDNPNNTKITRGFVGSHSDIGGSYGTGDLSDVALIWMHKQAVDAKVQMASLGSNFRTVSDPQLHDKNTVTASPNNIDRSGDRDVCTRVNNQRYATGCTQQKSTNYGPNSLKWNDTARFIESYETLRTDADEESKIVGKIDMRSYASWLKKHYQIDVGY